MSDKKGVNYTLFDGGTLLDPGAWAGKILVAYDKFTANALSSGSTITVARVPASARILPISTVMFEALGTGVTLSVGDGTTANKFCSATAADSAGSFTFDAIAGLGDPLSDVTDIVLTTGGAATTGSDKIIKVWVFYTLSG